MKKYDPKKIEPKWQKYWAKEKIFEVTESKTKEKFYGLIEFPYPSGEGLHVGHPRPFTAMDVITRKKRMEGKNVLFPIGFDAFGLPTENFAIKTGKPPAEVTKKNIANFTRQLKMLGFGFDWSRQVDTTDPQYYKWTQWLFLQFYKHGLAYKKNQPINWCPKDKIGLANEEVVGGCCERCGTAVEKRNKEQWMLSITKYADKLLEGLKQVNYIERARTSQENWIGKSEGAEVVFPLCVPSQPEGKYSVTVFTTRPDTIFGVTFLAISPELAKSWLDVGWDAGTEVKKYIDQELKNRAATTTREEQEKTGISAGIMAINPVSKEQIPVWITNYVMGGVGTGAIMGVPAHDERDFDFAKKFGLPLKQVVKTNDEAKEKTKYLIFDFDGVIGDTWEAGLEVQMKVGDLTKKFANKEEAKEATLQYFSRKPNHAKDTLLTTEQLEARAEWAKKYGEEMAKINPPLFDDFNKIVRDLPNIKTAIISAGSGLYIKNRIAETGLNPTHVLTYEDHYSKEEKIERLCKDWGVSMQDVYYFTDSKADVYELENCMDRKKIIGCAWGYCGYDLLKELLPENQILKDFADINTLFGAELFTEEGVAINSDFLNGLKTDEAKEKMIAWLQENKIGKKQVNYKLRDWVFSRQRYWGEPIPLVFCEHCKNKKQKALLIHGFESSGDGVWLPWMKKELEKQGFEVFNPSMTNNFHATVDSWLAELKRILKSLEKMMLSSLIVWAAKLRFTY
jgi:leucyl-tRNA synthetase